MSFERKLAEQMSSPAEAAGYSTLVLTTDIGVNGNRERDLRNNFGLPMHYTPGLIYDGVTHPRWSLGFMLNGMPQHGNFVTADFLGCRDAGRRDEPTDGCQLQLG
jgi:(S)-mandelate dehydrogenase